MTCAYGASVKSGVSSTAQVLVDRSLWETVTGTPSSWFDWLLDIFVPATIQASDLCALNLADPTLPSLAVLGASFRGDGNAIQLVSDYVRDKLRYSAFTNACVCNAAPVTCVAQQFLANFSGLGCTSGAEEVGNRFVIDSACTISGFYPPWINGGGSPQAGRIDLWDNTAGTIVRTDTYSISAFPTAPVLWTSGPFTPVVGQSYTLAIEKANASCYAGNLTTSGITWNPYAHETGNGFWAAGFTTLPTTALGALVGVEPYLCSSSAPTTPPAPVVPTQPPTLTLPPAWSCSTVADVCVRLQQLQEQIGWLIRSQPIASPIRGSLSQGTAHVALTGSGTLSVSGILGLLVTLTTVPSSLGFYPDSPRTTIGAGWVSWHSQGGWISQVPIQRTPQELLFDVLTVDQVGYFFPPGVVATITELTRGP